MDKPSVWEAIFDKGEKTVSKEHKIKKKFFTHEFSGSITQRLNKLLSSPIFRFNKSVNDLIAHIPTRIFGTALLCFGLLGAVLYFVGITADKNIANPIVAIILSCISIPLPFPLRQLRTKSRSSKPRSRTILPMLRSLRR